MKPQYIYGIAVLFLVLGFATGFMMGKTGGNASLPQDIQKGNNAPAANTIFKTQSANIQGVITNVAGKNITVKNDAGITDTFPVSDRVAIFTQTDPTKVATASSDLTTIETNKPVIVNLEIVNSDYQVVSVFSTPSQN